MSPPVRIAVIGRGYWGSKLLREYAAYGEQDSSIELVGLAEPDPDNLEAAREDIPGMEITTADPADILSAPSVDAVHIATPNHTHFELASQALKAGKHVLLEKPMTLEGRKAYELVELAAKEDRVLNVGHIFRHNNAIEDARSLVQSGKLGRIYSLRLRWTSLLQPLPERDILFDLAPHPIDIANNILVEWPHKVTAHGKSPVRRESGREEEATVVLEFPDGKSALVEMSWISPGEKVREVYVRGSQATVRIDALNQEMILYPDGPEEAVELPVEENNTMTTQVKAFADQIRGDGDNLGSGYIGAKTIEILERLRSSIREERTVHVDAQLTDHSAQPPPAPADQPALSKLVDVELGDNVDVRDMVNLYKCTIGPRTKVDSYVYIEEGVQIGADVKIRPFTFIPTGVTIGDGAFIGPGVVFTNDRFPRAQGDWELEETHVGDGATIGARAVLMPGITVGEGAMVGAGSVVLDDVPDHAVVAGNPARVLRRLQEAERA